MHPIRAMPGTIFCSPATFGAPSCWSLGWDALKASNLWGQHHSKLRGGKQMLSRVLFFCCVGFVNIKAAEGTGHAVPSPSLEKK